MTLPSSRVAALCELGMAAEATRGRKAARALFERAWAARRDDVDACVAAHYLARQQDDVQSALAWHRRALEHAEAAGTQRTRAFLPSLHLNIASSLEDLDQDEAAREHYRLARHYSRALPEDGYGAMIRRGIAAGAQRVTPHGGSARRDGCGGDA